MNLGYFRAIDHRPVAATCIICGQPIFGKLGNYEGENIILMDNGDTVHDKPECGMMYLREHFLIKG